MRLRSLAFLCAVAACRDEPSIPPNCTQELRILLAPRETTLAVGQSFTAILELSTCGGFVKLSDSFAWSARNPAVADVDPRLRRITAKAQGVTSIDVSGRRYGSLGSIQVSVVATPSP
jgi:hypothetical protein